MDEGMRGVRLDDIERHLHHGFVGREAVLAALDRSLVADGSADRCVVVTGAPGMGKTALVVAWLAERQAARDFIAHHFVRRAHGDRIEPSAIARSLAAQIEERYPGLRDPYARPEARLGELVARVSARELADTTGRLVLAIDGLDEGDLRDVLELLPRPLPRGIRILCAGRHRTLDLEALGLRAGQPVFVDLDDASSIDDNEDTVRAYWRREAPALGLDDRFVEQAVRCSGGNLLHAAALRRHLASAPPSQRSAEAIPRGLPSLLAALWSRVASDFAALRALGILCAAREPLSLDRLSRVAGWTDPGDARAILHVVRELVVELKRSDGATAHWLFHDAIRSHVTQQLGSVAMRAHHRELADKLATWPAPRDGDARRYALAHAISHCVAAGNCTAVHALARNLDFLEAKCGAFGVDAIELDLRRARDACLAEGRLALASELDDLARALAREARTLRSDPASGEQVWARLRSGKSSALALEPTSSGSTVGGRAPVGQPHPAGPRDLGATTEDARATPGTCPAHAVTGAVKVGGMHATGAVLTGGSAVKSEVGARLLGRPVVRHKLNGGVGVTACAVTPDGRLAVVATSDHTLQVWDLETGHLLGCTAVHTAPVTSCAITAEGRRVVSASEDTTLRVGDLETGQMIATLGDAPGGAVDLAAPEALGDRAPDSWDASTGDDTTLSGHRAAVTDCAIAADGRSLYSASYDTTVKIWDLHTGRVVTTLAAHAGPVTCCAVTPDGRYVVSGSDLALRMWDTGIGRAVTLGGHAQITCCAVTPDGRGVISGSSDGTLRIWNVDTFGWSQLEGHRDGVTDCALTADGKLLYSASHDGTLKQWDVATGKLITRLEDHGAPVTCCAVAPDGRRLVSGSSDGAILVWDITTSRPSTIVGLVPRPPVTPPARRTAKPPVSKHRILFLAANPTNTNQLMLDKEECAAIENELQAARHGKDFEFHSKWRVTVDAMARHLFDCRPTIVHLTGHGRGAPSNADAPGRPPADSGIYLHQDEPPAIPITNYALALMIKSAAPTTRVVVLNACYSDRRAEALVQVADCVVGTTRQIQDHSHAARSFAEAFYRALGNRESLGIAVEHAKSILAAKGFPDDIAPRCRTRAWDAHEMFL